MGRGRLSEEEIAQLKQNKYVIDANETRIIYSNEFKEFFMKEYKKGANPREIFRSGGFDPEVLGTKRIERACARWREADAAGTLGKNGYTLQAAKGERQEALASQRDMYERRLEAKDKQLSRQHDEYEQKLDRKDQETRRKLQKKQDEIQRLKAENELLKKAGKLGKGRCKGKAYGTADLYPLVKDTVWKYGLYEEIGKLCKTVGLPKEQYYQYESTIEEN